MSAAVVPSGADLAAASQAIRPPAPVRFSTTKVLPAPPAEKGTRMRKARGAVCADAAKLKDPRARARSAARKVFISSLHERPAADVEILAHGHVHEPARAAQRPRDVALALHVLGEDEVSRQAQGAMAVARLELEDARGEENQLTPRSIVKILDMAFGGLAEKNRVAAEGFRRGPFALGHRHLADFDRRVSRVLREYPHDAHTGGTIGLKDHAPSLAQGLFRREPRPGKARIIGVRGQLATGAGRGPCPPCASGQGPSTFFMDDFPKAFCYT